MSEEKGIKTVKFNVSDEKTARPFREKIAKKERKAARRFNMHQFAEECVLRHQQSKRKGCSHQRRRCGITT